MKEKRRYQIFLNEEAEEHLNLMWEQHQSLAIKNYSNLINYLIINHRRLLWERDILLKEVDKIKTGLRLAEEDKNAYRENRNEISKQVQL